MSLLRYVNIVTQSPGFAQPLAPQDIEYDLVNDTRHVLPRVLQKMLYALSYDRKVSYVYPVKCTDDAS